MKLIWLLGCYLERYCPFFWPSTCSDLISSMEQSPFWEANSLSASQEIPRPVWNPEVHYHVREPDTGPNPEPDESSPHFPTPLTW